MSTAKRQVAMVLDLNKCIGCHTCSVACKTLWTREEGQEHMLFNTVNTMPGLGTPKSWEQMGGGFPNGQAILGQLPSTKAFGEAWEYNHDEVFYGGKGQSVHLQIQGEQPDWGPNWDEDQGAGEFPNSYFFYLPRVCNHCTHPACAEACPYKKIYFNHVKKVSQKCIFCYPRLEQGVAQACARQCPGRVRFVGYKDDQNAPI